MEWLIIKYGKESSFCESREESAIPRSTLRKLVFAAYSMSLVQGLEVSFKKKNTKFLKIIKTLDT